MQETMERFCVLTTASCVADETNHSLLATGEWRTVSSFFQCTFSALERSRKSHSKMISWFEHFKNKTLLVSFIRIANNR